MDIDRPIPRPSRDPRLANRQPGTHPSPPARNGSLDSQGRPSAGSTITQSPSTSALTKGPNQSGDEFIHGISNLVQAGLTKARSISEREKLLKKKEKTDNLLKRTKAQSGFPATLDYCQQASKDEMLDLRRLDDTIRQHESRYRALESTLRSSLGSAFSRAPSNLEERMAKLEKDSEDRITALRTESDAALVKYRNYAEGRIAKLESEINQAKSAAVDAEKRATQASTVNQTLTEAVTNVQDKLALLQTARGGNDSPIAGQNKEVTSSHAQAVKQLRTEIDGLKRELSKLVSDLFKTQSLPMFEQLNRAVEEQRVKIEALQPNAPSKKATDSPILMSKAVMLRLQELEGSLAKFQANSNLDATGNLSKQLREIQGIQTMQSEIHESENNEVKKTLDQHSEELKAIKNGYKEVSGDLKKTGQENSAIMQEASSISASLGEVQRALQTTKVSFHSLETRYNNLSTESMVKNMAMTIQELYPTANQLSKQFSTLKANIVREIQALDGRANQLSNAQNECAKQSHNVSMHLGALGNIRSEFNQLSQAFVDFRQNLQDPMKAFHQLQDKFAALEQQSTEHGEKLVQLESKENVDPEAIRKLEEGRNSLNSEIEKLVRQAASLAEEFNQVKAANETRVGTANAHAIELDGFKDRVSRLEETTSAIESGYDRHEKKINTHEQDFKNLNKHVNELEESTTNDYQQLEEKVAELQKSTRRKSSGPSKSSPRPGAGNPARSPEPDMLTMAETNPASALREKKKKKKRPHPESPGEPEKPSTPVPGRSSPATNSVATNSVGIPGENGERKKKKKKKQKTETGAVAVQ